MRFPWHICVLRKETVTIIFQAFFIFWQLRGQINTVTNTLSELASAAFADSVFRRIDRRCVSILLVIVGENIAANGLGVLLPLFGRSAGTLGASNVGKLPCHMRKYAEFFRSGVSHTVTC